MAFNRVQIISYALTLMGRKPVSSLVNQGDIVTSADQAFDLLLTSALSIGFWRFATTIAVLQKLAETPVGGYWMYSYMLPADYLKMVHLYPHTYDFELYNNSRLYSNYSSGNSLNNVNNQINDPNIPYMSGNPFYIEYVYRPSETLLPPYFVKYFSFELASYLALSNAQTPDYLAELERRRVIELSIAQAADAQNRPQSPLMSKPMLECRYVSAFVGG
jgi:hypothetical protein